MATTKRRRNNLQWRRVVPGFSTVAPNTLSSASLISNTVLNLEEDDWTFVKGYVTIRVTANLVTLGQHVTQGAVGVIKRATPADTTQYDPIGEDAAWMWWKPIVLSSHVGQPQSEQAYLHWEFELNAGRRMERYDSITAFIKTRTGSDTITWSAGGSFLFYKS